MAAEVGKGVHLTIRGMKRKSFTESQPEPKRLRSRSYDDDSSGTYNQASDVSDTDASARESHSVATLPTPQSPGSPQYPSNLKKIPCIFDGCNKLFNRQAKLEQHLRSHTGTRPFLCPHAPCTKAYLRDSHLKHHIKSVHSRVRDHVCTWDGCGKAFATGTRFRRHIAAHEGNTKTCSVDGCGQVFRKHSTLEAHIRSVHQGMKLHICQFLDQSGKMCGMGFDKSAQLRSHEGRIHSRNSFECRVCPADQVSNDQPAFPTYGALQEHMKMDHPPACEQCGLACTSKSALKSHVEVKHGGTNLEERKNFICPKPGCGRAFTKKGNMNAHVQSAHDNKRYVCGSIDAAELNNVYGWDDSSACGKEFGTKGNLQKHIRTVHMGLESSSSSRAKNNKAARKSKRKSAVARITGASDDSIPCIILGCQVTFEAAHDLSSHLQAQHGLASTEIQAIMSMGEEKEVVIARPGLQGSSVFATNEELDAEAALDLLHNSGSAQDLGIGDGEDPSDGGRFWLGGDWTDRDPVTDEWVHEEEEMRRLITNDLYGGEDAETDKDIDIDPKLL